MPRHSLFPNSIHLKYTSNGHSHRQVLPIAAVTPSGASWDVTLRDSTAVDWKAAIDSYVAVLLDFFGTTDSIDSAELYDYEATDSPGIFMAAYDIGEAGTSVSAATDFTQIVFPFKALGGFSLRLSLMETIFEPDLRVSYGGDADARTIALMDFVLGSSDFIITRGGTYPSTSLGHTSKINDKLRERYFLD